jgi:small subunit ribosomal protein S1
MSGLQTEESFWLEVESEQAKIKRKPNRKVKTVDGDKVFYYGEDAQALYDLYEKGSSNYREPVKGQLVEAEIISITGDDAIFDIGYREHAYMDLKKESAEFKELFKVGTRLSVKIGENKTKDFISASFTDSVNEMKTKELIDAIGKDTVAYIAKVEELISAGYMVDIDGIKAFMPGSLAGLNKLHDFTVLLGKELPVMVVNYSKEKSTVVVSHRQYLHSLIPSAIEKIKENPAQLQKGFVTGSTKYGVFCEFNECLTGMIHSSDLTDDLKAKHEAGQIKPGDTLEFYVKEIITNFKIILTQFYKESPWEKAEEVYKPSSVVVGRITSIKEYGAFVELSPGISGLIHVSELKGKFKEGDTVGVRINKLDKVNKKVFLSLAADTQK